MRAAFFRREHRYLVVCSTSALSVPGLLPRLIVDMNAIKDPLGLEHQSMNTEIDFSMTAVIVVVVVL